MTDTRPDIYAKIESMQQALIGVRVYASTFDVSGAQAQIAILRGNLNAIDGDVSVLTPDVGGALVVSPFPNPLRLTSGQPFTYQFTAAGGAAPYRFLQSNGIVPAGLVLSERGLLTGTVLAAGGQDFSFGLLVLDAHGAFYGVDVELRIA